ncbi:hypothetical protein UA08_00187 [Talaromyces atroroseus]|uniref:Uncharacterized protein n=1 Tax=Talaromyces atroroseus TaxID=1441469 RepID=A0A225AW82_TALAT|nr:hypothetical protein UA08_00187 [Talaromyces atroroseus]OKL63873.1 hypothetical protein UA08_00187 [Talaromyces atroroseus]
MGVVVSGENGRPGILKDKKSIVDTTAENDYGLVIVAFDHVLHFIGFWWVRSLSRRIQTFKSYTHVPLIRLFRSECQRIGWAAELFAVEKAFSIIRYSTRVVSFIIFEQIHMFCILQTLHLIPHSAFLRPSMLLPFTKSSLIQSPSFPSDFTLTSLGRFASELAATPFAFAFAYILIRPFVEDRIYRMIRRHLPKPERPDAISIQVAMDNDLLEWTLPTAGRHTEYEIHRSNLTLFQDIKEEFWVLQKWLSRRLGYKNDGLSDDRISDSLSHNDPDTIRENTIQDVTARNHIDDTPITLGNVAPSPQLEASFISNQALTNGQFTQSPSEISPNSPNETRPTQHTETDGLLQPDVPGDSWNPDPDSRSDTLFSRPASPESPLASPRIRASLTHQNSFTTTMELSLQSSRNPNVQGNSDPISENDRGDTALSNWPELGVFELGPNEVNQNIPDGILEQPPAVSDAGRLDMLNSAEPDLMWEVLNGSTVLADVAQPAVLPHVVEEPMPSPMNPTGMDQVSEAGTEQSGLRQPHSLPPRSRSQHHSDLYKQRITVLSSYPADAIALHLASVISSVLFIPFESFFYRSLARAYLSSHTALLYGATSLATPSDIRVLNAFAGGGSRRDMVAYMGKLAMILGIQVGVSGSIIGVCSATAIGIGKSLFDWGRL